MDVVEEDSPAAGRALLLRRRIKRPPLQQTGDQGPGGRAWVCYRRLLLIVERPGKLQGSRTGTWTVCQSWR